MYIYFWLHVQFTRIVIYKWDDFNSQRTITYRLINFTEIVRKNHGRIPVCIKVHRQNFRTAFYLVPRVDTPGFIYLFSAWYLITRESRAIILVANVGCSFMMVASVSWSFNIGFIWWSGSKKSYPIVRLLTVNCKTEWWMVDENSYFRY